MFTRKGGENTTIGDLVDTAALKQVAGVELDPMLRLDEAVTPAFMDEEATEDPLIAAILFGYPLLYGLGWRHILNPAFPAVKLRLAPVKAENFTDRALAGKRKAAGNVKGEGEDKGDPSKDKENVGGSTRSGSRRNAAPLAKVKAEVVDDDFEDDAPRRRSKRARGK